MNYSSLIALLCSLFVHVDPASCAAPAPVLAQPAAPVQAVQAATLDNQQTQAVEQQTQPLEQQTQQQAVIAPQSAPVEESQETITPVGPPVLVQQSGPFLLQTTYPGLVQYSNIPIAYLNPQQPIDRIAAVISSNEGKPTSIDWNDNGKGVSVGIFQANQRVGDLPQVLHQMAMLPDGQQQLAAALGTPAARAVKSDPQLIRHYHFSPKNALGHGLKKLVHSPVFQRLQVAILRKKVQHAARLAARYGIHSTAGVAVCADLANQWGPTGAQRFLKAAVPMKTEGAKVKAVVHAVACSSPYGKRYIGDLEKVQANDLSFYQPFECDF